LDAADRKAVRLTVIVGGVAVRAVKAQVVAVSSTYLRTTPAVPGRTSVVERTISVVTVAHGRQENTPAHAAPSCKRAGSMVNAVKTPCNGVAPCVGSSPCATSSVQRTKLRSVGQPPPCGAGVNCPRGIANACCIPIAHAACDSPSRTSVPLVELGVHIGLGSKGLVVVNVEVQQVYIPLRRRWRFCCRLRWLR